MALFHDKDVTFSYYQRAKLVSQFTSLCSLIYHVGVFILFFFLKIYPLFFYNIVSISVFAVLFAKIKDMKNFIKPYIVAATEVIIHQILADHFLGSESKFHYFILLMGLLPFLIFEDKFRLSIPITVITVVLFIIFENIFIRPVYVIDGNVLRIIKFMNIFITVSIIVMMILIYTVIVFKIEDDLNRRKEVLEEEIKLASIVQQNFFYQNTASIKGWKLYCYSKAMAGVSGDFYDVFIRKEKLDGIGIFDVSGHGVSSGLVTMLVKNIIHREFYKKNHLELWETLNRINDRIIEEKGDIENYLTGILLRINKENVEIVNAGHPAPIIYKSATKKVSFLERDNRSIGAIGISEAPTYYISQFMECEKDDEIILYTDGITDAINEKGEIFGKERFFNVAENMVRMSFKDQINYLKVTMKNFGISKPVNDDITIIILRKEN